MNATVSRLPALGVISGMFFLALAAAEYPGGYDWTRHFISTLFAPITLNGDQNPSRPFAIFGMFLFCISMAILFHLISLKANSAFHMKTIQIGGMGSMVYALLAITPMHNLMVNISLVFFISAMFTILHFLYTKSSLILLSIGLVSLASLLYVVGNYYGNVHLEYLPIGQKLSFLMCACWLFAVQYTYNPVALE